MPPATQQPTHATNGIFAVVVLYKALPMESPSVLSLLQSQAAAGPSAPPLYILVADNTPGRHTIPELPEGVHYRAYPANPGLAEPYNDAQALAQQSGYPWLLTLDQDTDLPPDFIAVMAKTAAAYANDNTVAAVVPMVADHGRPISPLVYRAGFLPVVPRTPRTGIGPRHVSAINSGALLRCDALQSLGGYDPEFPLHNSDTRLFQKIDHARKRVVIADVQLSHEFSILRRSERISVERYRHMLQDECFFWDRHMSAAARLERLVRLAGRWCKSKLKHEAAPYVQVASSEFLRRLYSSRKSRMRLHEQQRRMR